MWKPNVQPFKRMNSEPNSECHYVTVTVKKKEQKKLFQINDAYTVTINRVN